MNIEKIKSDLITFNRLYRKGTPIVDDIAYDSLLDTYKNNVSEDEYMSFRNILFEETGKIKHPYIMGSLEKTKADENDSSLIKWVSNYNINRLFISSKIDGLSVRLFYKDGKLIDAVTRGDGEYGEDILNKAIHFVKTEVDPLFSGNIRAEIVLSNHNFIKLCEIDNKDYSNARTSACGLINSKEFNEEAIKLLKVVTYEIMGTDLTKQVQYDTLQKLGFETAKFRVLDVNNDTIKNDLIEIYNEFCDECDYTIDGLVLTSNDNNIFENIKIPKRAVAFKTNNLVKTTKIIDIEWNLSKSGFYKPVAILEPVELGGAMISRATLYNYEWVEDRKICYNATVEVLKSGDIIPRIMSINNEGCNQLVEVPVICACCNSKLERDGVELVCKNQNCEAQVILKVNQFIRRLKIENVSYKSLNNFGISSFETLLAWRPDPDYKSETKFYNELNKKLFNCSKRKIFTSLDFNGIGEKTVNKLIDSYGLDAILDKTIKNISCESLPSGIGYISFNTFLDALDDNLVIYNMVINDERYSEPDVKPVTSNVNGVLNGKSYCFTGKLNTLSRSDAENLVIQNGGKISGVNKNLTYLVTNDTDSGSSKNKKASDLGIKIINEEQFLLQISSDKVDINNI